MFSNNFAHLEMLQSKSKPSCRESTKQLADPKEDNECLAMSAPFISFSIARALLLTSYLKVLCKKYRHIQLETKLLVHI